MADGKWIEGLSGDSPLLEAAERVLRVRLQVTADCLPKAVYEAERDPEHVHQLRVATRRSGAALRLFDCCLPSKTARTARRRLRKLRRAAGEARDWDVFLIDRAARAQRQPDPERPGMDFLSGYALGQRTAAQAHLHRVGEKQGPSFDAFLRDTIAAVRPSAEENQTTLFDLACPVLAELLADLEQKATGDLTDYPHLHQVRIAGKRLRYAMEVFASCFDDSFGDKIYPQIEEMQDILGRANDSHVAAERLKALRDRLRGGLSEEWRRIGPGIEALRRFHQRRQPLERKRFLAWWNTWQSTGGPLLRGMLAPVF
jgi:CHAD domain-containing protein